MFKRIALAAAIVAGMSSPALAQATSPFKARLALLASLNTAVANKPPMAEIQPYLLLLNECAKEDAAAMAECDTLGWSGSSAFKILYRVRR